MEVLESKVEVPAAGGEEAGAGEGTLSCAAKQRGKRKAKGWSLHKKGGKSRGLQDTVRKAKVNEEVERIKRARQEMEDPYDNMDIDTKKEHALFLYCDKMAKILTENEIAFSSKSVSVKKKVSKRVGVSLRTMRRWVLEYWCEEKVTQSKRGKHSKD